jgi:CPA1 family monovalent cation:H+ antiporter
MQVLFTIAAILGLTALFSYINERFLQLQQTIGLMLLALGFTLVLMLLNALGLSEVFAREQAFVTRLSLDATLLNGVLCFMLFAGSINVKIRILGEEKWVILILAIGATLIAALLIGSAVSRALGLIGIGMGLMFALAMTIAYAGALSMDWPNPHWAGFAVAAISLSTVGQSLNKGAMRMLGTPPGRRLLADPDRPVPPGPLVVLRRPVRVRGLLHLPDGGERAPVLLARRRLRRRHCLHGIGAAHRQRIQYRHLADSGDRNRHPLLHPGHGPALAQQCTRPARRGHPSAGLDPA